MIISNEQAEYLLGLSKRIVEREQLLDNITICQKFPFSKRYELVSEQDDEFTFLWEFQQSQKNTVRLSFHAQENNSKIGLLRVDYNSGHQNPVQVSKLVPEKFHPYAGKRFTNKEHHIHYHVEGYKSLAWAIPLTDDGFPIKELPDVGFNNTFADVIKSFAKVLNVKTVININTLLL